MAFIDFEELDSIRDSYLDYSYAELHAEKKRILSEDKPDMQRLSVLDELLRDSVCENYFRQEE